MGGQSAATPTERQRRPTEGQIQGNTRKVEDRPSLTRACSTQTATCQMCSCRIVLSGSLGVWNHRMRNHGKCIIPWNRAVKWHDTKLKNSTSDFTESKLAATYLRVRRWEWTHNDRTGAGYTCCQVQSPNQPAFSILGRICYRYKQNGQIREKREKPPAPSKQSLRGRQPAKLHPNRGWHCIN